MKINMIIIPIPIQNGMAGAKRLGNLANHLKTDEDVTIHNLIIGREKPVQQVISGIKVKAVAYHISNIASIAAMYCNVVRYLRLVKNNSSINVLYNYGYPNIKNLLILVIAKRILGYKIIFDIVEDNTTIRSYKSFFSRIKIFSSNYLFNKLPLLANGAVAISDHLESKLLKVSKKTFPIIKLPISINTNCFESNVYDNEKISIFYGGSYGEKDGLEYLLKAFDRVANEYNNIELVLTGRGTERDMDKFFLMLDNIKNSNQILYKGYVSDSEYYSILNRANIHCMTRISSKFAQAGFPFKLGEMLATGNPVIATRLDSVSNLLSDQKNSILVNSCSIEEIQNAIKYLITHREMAKLIGFKGRELALELFDSRNHSLKLKEFIEIGIR